MIISLTLKNFRKHTDTTITFAAGLNAIRGPNEIGKTTLIEAVLYALFGATALRDPLADTVTWGARDSDLSVKVVLRVNSMLYEYSRSKAGAECNYEGGKVVGQKEVSAFAADMLGADAKMASMLMLASQSGLRGALDDGPAAVSGLMTKLADADIIDRILDQAAAQLALGSEVPLQQKLAAAAAEVETAKAAIPEPGAAFAVQAEINSYADTVAIEQRNNDNLSDIVTKAETKLADARQAQSAHYAAQQAVDAAQRRLDAERTALAGVGSTERPDAAEIQRLRDAVRQEKDHAGVVAAYAKARAAFDALGAYPQDYWDSTEEAFRAELEVMREGCDSTARRIHALEGEIQALESQKITSGKCPTCGSVSNSDEHVAAHNAGLQQKIDVAWEALAELKPKLRAMLEDRATLDSIQRLAAARDIKLRAVPAHMIEIDTTCFPASVTWIAEAPPAVAGNSQPALTALEAQDRAAVQAAGRAEAHRAAIERLGVELSEASARAELLPNVDTQPFEEAVQRASESYRASSERLLGLKMKVVELQQQHTELVRNAVAAQDRLEAAQARVTEYTDDIKKLGFNNGLVTKLKKLKPAITDHLWNVVLSAVSVFFTSMRGEQSIVTKEASGFMVNGKKASSLSGSTLDVLAIAIRVALTKTFVPHVPFISLDEPAHGCDAMRTGNVLGFLASSGFEQVLLASHDELTEAVADNVIQLGD